jgi:beta-galactosidase
MENARHPNELPPVYQTVVRLASKQMGVGGDDSWGARTHDEYLLDVSKPLHFSFTFCGITQRTIK